MTYPSREDICKAYREEFLKRRDNPEEFAKCTETILVDLIQRYESASFTCIYECTDRKFYQNLRNKIATNQQMSAEDQASGLLFSIHLKTYCDFLESKAFKVLFRDNLKVIKKPKPPKSNTPSFRQETEGERKHIQKEVDVIYRNPILRQQCIDKYGYQCQCCGINFATLYGEELGSNFIEVHHLKPISTFETDGIPEDFLENLVPLCSNCHSMIHHIKNSEHPLRDLRKAYLGKKEDIKVWKED